MVKSVEFPNDGEGYLYPKCSGTKSGNDHYFVDAGNFSEAEKKFMEKYPDKEILQITKFETKIIEKNRI